MIVLPYELYENIRAYLDKVPLATEPEARFNFIPKKFNTKIIPYYFFGLVSKYGPLITRKYKEIIDLDSVDGTPYKYCISIYTGKPAGAVFRKAFRKGILKRTLN